MNADFLQAIAEKASLIRKGYPEAAASYQQQRETLGFVRADLRETAEPGTSVEFHPEVKSQRGMTQASLIPCREYWQRLSELTSLIFRHLPELARKHPILERTPPPWHDRPVGDWGELLAALRDAEVAASESTTTLGTDPPPGPQRSMPTQSVRANTSKLFPNGKPNNRYLVEFVQYLDENRDGRKSDTQLAREYTKETGKTHKQCPKASALLDLLRTNRNRGKIGI